MKIEFVHRRVFDIGTPDRPHIEKLLNEKQWPELRIELEAIDKYHKNPTSIVIYEQLSYKEVE